VSGKKGPGPEFWNRADAVIGLANEQCRNADSGEVSSSLLYAAARFNAHIVGISASDRKELEAHREESIAFFSGEYKKMLIENLDDYIENYDKYMAKRETS
jgi:hypothetical protein